jgi:hypothetical protein
LRALDAHKPRRVRFAPYQLAIGGFPLAMARPERITDNATVEFLDTRHFALETHIAPIAAAM